MSGVAIIEDPKELAKIIEWAKKQEQEPKRPESHPLQSVLKMEYLDRLDVKEQGVHPDVPKNASKSITVG